MKDVVLDVYLLWRQVLFSVLCLSLVKQEIIDSTGRVTFAKELSKIIAGAKVDASVVP